MMNKIFLRFSMVLVVCSLFWGSTSSETSSVSPTTTLDLNLTTNSTSTVSSGIEQSLTEHIPSTSSSKLSAIDLITDSSHSTDKLAINEPVLENNEDEISFGIRSFTVEVSTNEKTSTSTTTAPLKTESSDNESKKMKASNINKGQKSFDEATTNMQKSSTTTTVSIPSLKQPKSTQTPDAVTYSSTSFMKEENVLKSDLKILFNDDDAETPAFNEMRTEINENEIHNEIKGEEKLKNGLYRVQLGEITTDEFNNRLNLNRAEEEQEVNRYLLPSDIPVHRKEPKVNIDDFFPSKREDFKSIIEISNEKLLKEKNSPYSEQEEKSNIGVNRDVLDKNVKTGTQINTDIEIELVDDPSSPSTDDENLKIQPTKKPIQKKNESIEKSKLTSNVASSGSITMKRTKKFDPSMKSKNQASLRINDFAMTKFSQLKSNKSQATAHGDNPEFSTTKFYNSKESHSVDKVKKSTTSPSHAQEKKQKKTQTEASKIASIVQETSTNSHQRTLSRLAEKLITLDCDIQNLSADATVWRGNETHELSLPITTPEDCSSGTDCLPLVISWEASADIQSGDVLIVEIDDKFLVPTDKKNEKSDKIGVHHNTAAAVYQVTRLGHEHCDITEGELLDITPLIVDGRKLVTLYDKDLTEGVNLLIVVSEFWEQQCVRLRVNVKSDNCGENAECSGKGICFSNTSMEGYECECCNGFAGSHCEEIDACTPSPCTNNGICVDLSQGHEGNSYQCLCPYGYTGKNCQSEADPCNPSQCLNGGTCITNTTHFRCECAQGYTGPICQHNLNECDSSPCIHGICVDQEDGFRCFCQPGFSGDLCNFEYNECDSNPCINQGQCIDHIGGYSCQCTKGYQGKRCHLKIDFCANNPCADGYRCVDHGDEYSCVCPGAGDHNVPDCHEVPRTLCTTNPCKNAGTCWTSDESFYCACRPGFTGKLCEDDFVIDTVVSSSELLSDMSDSNVITFNEVSNVNDFGLHHVYVAVTILVLSMLVLGVVVTIAHYKAKGHSINYRQLIPFFKRPNKAKTFNEHSQHWLRGKNSSFFEENHINLKNELPPSERHFTSSTILSSPLQMNLDNDTYCSVNFGDSQQSLLIQ